MAARHLGVATCVHMTHAPRQASGKGDKHQPRHKAVAALNRREVVLSTIGGVVALDADQLGGLGKQVGASVSVRSSCGPYQEG